MLIFVKELVFCLTLAGLVYMWFRSKADRKANLLLNQRVSELECRIVIRVEDRLTLVEQGLDQLQEQRNAE